MNPLLRALLGPWAWRPEVLAMLLPLLIVYVVGWFNIRRRRRARGRAATSRVAQGWRLACYLTGMGSLLAALLSPIDALGGQLFFMHMIQHKVVVMVSAPLLWLGNPFVVGLWGLPRRLRMAVGSLFVEESRLRAWLTAATNPLFVWLLFVVAIVGWHDPAAYNQALRKEWVHDLQHISFFVTAMLFWWHVIGAAPRLHKYSAWVAIAMLIGAIPFNAITGFVIANTESVLYTYYESIPRIWGFGVLDDQSIAGVIMWVPGSEMFFQAAGGVLAWMFVMDRRKNKQPAVSGALAVPDEALIAPGLEHRALQNKWRALADERLRARREANG